MSRRETLLITRRMLRARRLRSGLTLLSLVIGVSAVILLIACGHGVQNSINERVESVANAIAIVPKNADVPGGPRARNLTDADADALRDAPDVATVTPSINSSGMVISAGTAKLLSATTIGTTEIWAETNNRVLTAGEFFDRTQAREAARVAVVGPTVASTLFRDPAAALNQTVQISHVPFRVIGVLASYGQQLDNTVVVPLETDRRYIVGSGGTGDALNAITVQASRQAVVPDAINQVTNILDTRHRISDPSLRDFQVQSLGRRLQTFDQIARIVVLFTSVIAVILLVVGGIGVLNIMLASVAERTREVSTDKASDTNRGIRRKVLIESIVLAGFGGLIGVGVGVGLVFLIQEIAPIFDSSGALAGFTPVLSVPAVVLAFAISLLIGLIAGSYPAYRANRPLPSQPLSYQ